MTRVSLSPSICLFWVLVTDSGRHLLHSQGKSKLCKTGAERLRAVVYYDTCCDAVLQLHGFDQRSFQKRRYEVSRLTGATNFWVPVRDNNQILATGRRVLRGLKLGMAWDIDSCKLQLFRCLKMLEFMLMLCLCSSFGAWLTVVYNPVCVVFSLHPEEIFLHTALYKLFV